jgi:hypothetical protein
MADSRGRRRYGESLAKAINAFRRTLKLDRIPDTICHPPSAIC